MQMDGWQDHLHFGLLGEHVLFRGLRLDSPWHFIVACLLTIAICLCERALTYAMSREWSPLIWTKRSRVRKALWKAMVYWLVTFLRLLYMLVAMTFSIWLILITVSTLSVGQFMIEYLESPDYSSQRDVDRVKERLLSPSPKPYETTFALHPYSTHEHANEYPYRLSSSSASTSSLPRAHSKSHSQSTVNIASESHPERPHPKHRPDNLWIHPSQSNAARADATALELGLTGDTELVTAFTLPQEGPTAWEVGKGKDVAREIMGQQSRP